MKIKVFHINYGTKQEGYDLHLYCGRPKSFYPEGLINANLGNPFFMENEKQRDKVCDEYHEMLLADHKHPHWKVIQRIGLRLHEGKSIALYCFCAPKRCHCDSIRSFAITTADALEANLV